VYLGPPHDRGTESDDRRHVSGRSRAASDEVAAQAPADEAQTLPLLGGQSGHQLGDARDEGADVTAVAAEPQPRTR